MRDALIVLEQAISNSEQDVSLEDVLAVTGGVSQQVLTTITHAMFEQNVEEGLKKLDELIQHGKDPVRFVIDQDRKSTRLNSSHVAISYAVFCLKKKKKTQVTLQERR